MGQEMSQGRATSSVQHEQQSHTHDEQQQQEQSLPTMILLQSSFPQDAVMSSSHDSSVTDNTFTPHPYFPGPSTHSDAMISYLTQLINKEMETTPIASGVSQHTLHLRSLLSSITSFARLRHQHEHARQQAELAMKYQAQALEMAREFEEKDRMMREMHQTMEEIVSNQAVDSAVAMEAQRQHKKAKRRKSSTSDVVPSQPQLLHLQSFPAPVLPAFPPTTTSSTISSPTHQLPFPSVTQQQEQQQQQQHSPISPLSAAWQNAASPANPTFIHASAHATHAAATSCFGDFTPWSPMLYDETMISEQDDEMNHDLQKQLYGQSPFDDLQGDSLPPPAAAAVELEQPSPPNRILGATATSNMNSNKNLEEEDLEKYLHDALVKTLPHQTPNTSSIASSSQPHQQQPQPPPPPPYRNLSKVYLKNYLDLDLLTRIEEHYQSGTFSANATRAHLMYLTSNLDTEDQSELLTQFAHLKLEGCASVLCSCDHLDIQPTPGVPCCPLRAPLSWGGEFVAQARADFLRNPEGAHSCKAIFDLFHAAIESSQKQQDGDETDSLNDQMNSLILTDEEMNRLGVHESSKIYLAHWQKMWKPQNVEKGINKRDLSPRDAIADDEDGVARVRMTMMFSAPQKKQKKRKGLKKNDSSQRQENEEEVEQPHVGEQPQQKHTGIVAATYADAMANTNTTSTSNSASTSTNPSTTSTDVDNSDTNGPLPLAAGYRPGPASSEPSSHFYRSIQVNHAYERLTGYTQADCIAIMSNMRSSAAVGRHVREDHTAALHAIHTMWKINNITEGHSYQVRYRKDGSEYYCLVHIKSHTDRGLFLGAVQSIIPLPVDEEHPMPPFHDGIDLDVETLLYGYSAAKEMKMNKMKKSRDDDEE